jgi:hypothetical protein
MAFLGILAVSALVAAKNIVRSGARAATFPEAKFHKLAAKVLGAVVSNVAWC